MRKKNFEKQYEEIGGILHVVSEVCVIPGINSLGSIAQVNIRDRPKLFEIIFEFCSQQIMILQLLTSRLIPKFSKNSNENLLFRHRIVSELRKMHF